MNKVFSFLAGMISGALVGGVTALLLTPASGADLKTEVHSRIAAAKDEFQRSFEETYQNKTAEFERMKKG